MTRRNEHPEPARQAASRAKRTSSDGTTQTAQLTALADRQVGPGEAGSNIDQLSEREQTRMSAAAAATGTTPTRARQQRVVGATAIALAASFAIQNAVVAGAPAFGDPITEVLAFHADKRVAVAIAVGLEAVNLPLLLGFVTGLHGLIGRRGGVGAHWSRLAVAAAAALSAVFALYAVLWIGVVLSARGLTEPTPAFQLVWQLHAAAFALTLPALGTTVLAAALATHASGLTQGWQRLLGVAGAGLLLAAGAASLAIADGSPLLFVGMPGYAAWLVWLVATGIRLVPARSADRPENASTYDGAQ